MFWVIKIHSHAVAGAVQTRAGSAGRTPATQRIPGQDALPAAPVARTLGHRYRCHSLRRSQIHESLQNQNGIVNQQNHAGGAGVVV